MSERFEWHFWNHPRPTTDPSKVGAGRAAVPWADRFVAQWEPLASTRYGDPLGVGLEIVAGREVEPGSRFASAQFSTEAAPAAVYWLHQWTELTQHDAVAELLRVVIGLTVETPRPEWVDGFRLPSEIAAAEKVEERERELAAASNAVALARAGAADEGRFAGLLFEQGKERLEPLVRDVYLAL